MKHLLAFLIIGLVVGVLVFGFGFLSKQMGENSMDVPSVGRQSAMVEQEFARRDAVKAQEAETQKQYQQANQRTTPLQTGVVEIKEEQENFFESDSGPGGNWQAWVMLTLVGFLGWIILSRIKR